MDNYYQKLGGVEISGCEISSDGYKIKFNGTEVVTDDDWTFVSYTGTMSHAYYRDDIPKDKLYSGICYYRIQMTADEIIRIHPENAFIREYVANHLSHAEKQKLSDHGFDFYQPEPLNSNQEPDMISVFNFASFFTKK
jgi:hypothetical protein